MTPVATDPGALRTRLAEIAGESNVMSGERLAPFSANGELPVAVAFPANEAEIVEVAKLALQERVPVVPWGGGTKQDVEPVQPRDGIVLGMSRLNSVDIDAANLTIRVGAGKLLDELQRELAGERLFLPLDPMDSARSTVGGTIATNSSGPNRLLYRTARDLVLGLRVVSPSGVAIRAGGKTVKDVAGYDLKKLYIGSWGTLGAITEVTLRLLPLPEASVTVVASFPFLSSACSAASGLLASFLIPSAAELLSHDAVPELPGALLPAEQGQYTLAVSAEGAAEAVERQRREIPELAAKNGAAQITVLQGADERAFWLKRKAVFATLPQDRPSMLIKGSVLLKRVFDYISGLAGLEKALGVRASIASHAGNGIVYGLVSAEMGQAEKLIAAADTLQRLAADCGGFSLVQRAPREVVARMRLWPLRSDYGLMGEIKARLDPDNLWNPARVPGGRV